MNNEPIVVVRDATPENSDETKHIPPYAVIVHNDDRHTFEYVIETFQKVFGYSAEKCTLLAKQIDGEGLAIVWSGSKEVAELKQEQLLNAGPDFYATNPGPAMPPGIGRWGSGAARTPSLQRRQAYFGRTWM